MKLSADSLELEPEPDLDPEPDFDPEELEPEELEPEELEPEELEPDPDPFLSCRGTAWSILSRLVRRSSEVARPPGAGVADGRSTQRARARQCVGRPMVAGLVAAPWLRGLLNWPGMGPQVAR